MKHELGSEGWWNYLNIIVKWKKSYNLYIWMEEVWEMNGVFLGLNVCQWIDVCI